MFNEENQFKNRQLNTCNLDISSELKYTTADFLYSPLHTFVGSHLECEQIEL